MRAAGAAGSGLEAGVVPLATYGNAAIPVPYVIARSGELVEDRPVFAMDQRRGREEPYLTYAPGKAADWVSGMLRVRVADTGVGEPLWRKVNTVRQWKCMNELLCQICGLPAAEPGQPLAWVLTEASFQALSWVRDAGDTNQPAVCREHLSVSLRLCPRLRAGAEVVMVEYAEPVAVLAAVFEPGPGADWRIPKLVGHNVYVGLDEFARHPRVLATQLVMRLYGIRRGDGGAESVSTG